jgi:hypothetical protein
MLRTGVQLAASVCPFESNGFLWQTDMHTASGHRFGLGNAGPCWVRTCLWRVVHLVLHRRKSTHFKICYGRKFDKMRTLTLNVYRSPELAGGRGGGETHIAQPWSARGLPVVPTRHSSVAVLATRIFLRQQCGGVQNGPVTGLFGCDNDDPRLYMSLKK